MDKNEELRTKNLELKTIFVSLGSNIGDREVFLSLAREELKKIGKIIKQSSIYETEPLGDSKHYFLNQIVEIETNLDPQSLLQAFKKIEKKIGRRQRGRWMEREIDLDLLFVSDLNFWSKDLKVPHSEIQHRKFVLQPLSEVAPNFVHPTLGLSIRRLLKCCPDRLRVRKVS